MTPSLLKSARLRAVALGAVFCAFLAGSAPAGAGPASAGVAPAGEMTAEDVLALAHMTAEQRQALMRGDILAVGMGDGASEDATPSLLDTGLAMWVPQPMEQAVEGLTGPPDQHAGGDLVVELPESGPLPEIPLQSRHADEVERILSFSGGRKVNLSEQELESLRSLGVSAPVDGNEISAFARAYRGLLEERVASYRRNGLSGIAPYTRGNGKAQSVGDELTLATKRAVGDMARFLPEFCDAIRQYPRPGQGTHRYLLVHDTWDDRPQFILVHRMQDVTPSHAAFLHREFFVSQGYDAMQLFILMVPYQGGTLIALSTDVFTDQVAGFGSSFLQFVGRKRVRQAAEHRMVKIREAIAAAAAASTAVTASTAATASTAVTASTAAVGVMTSK